VKAAGRRRRSEEEMGQPKSWRATWRRWSPFQKFAAIGLAIGTPLAFFQLTQMIWQAATWGQEKIYGLPPLELPLKQIHAGMLEEIEYNLDCLKSFDRLRSADVDFELCEPKRKYIESWFANIAALTSRDFYSSSEYTKEEWEMLKIYYLELKSVKSHKNFIDLEARSDLTLRDALFLTGYIRYFYTNYFEEPMPEECGLRDNSPECLKSENRLFGDTRKWHDQIDGWGNMPAKYTVDDGKRLALMSSGWA
jgi:hypothetical protein